MSHCIHCMDILYVINVYKDFIKFVRVLLLENMVRKGRYEEDQGERNERNWLSLLLFFYLRASDQ